MAARRPLAGVPAPTFARHDPATALASLFRPVCRGRRPKGLDVTHRFDGATLRFTCFEWLDVRDQSVLLACCALAGIESSTLAADAPGEVGRKLWLDLQAEHAALRDRAGVVVTTRYQVLAAAGLDNNEASYDRLKDTLYRLSQLGIRVKLPNGQDWGMQMLSYRADGDGHLVIALNGRMVEALAGQHVRVSLSERRELPSEIAELAHCWLTAAIRQGRHMTIRLDTLAGHVWGIESANATTRRTRRLRIAEALEALNGLHGWKVRVEGRGDHAKATIWRHRIMDDREPAETPAIEAD